MRGIWIQIIVWVAYLMADWVAVVALGQLSDFASQGDSSSRSNKDGPNSALMALWAPLLLLHLGGPDTITAFSVEDVELWLRHLVGLVVQVALVIYIFLRCWTHQSHPLLFLSIPMFVAGVVKYAFSIIRKGAEYSKVDIDITYLLLVGAVLLEVNGIALMISSEWMILWMVGHLKIPQLRLWNVWDIRLLVLWSLTLQIILIVFGGRRKYIRGIWIQIIVWVAYLMADWVAVVALGKLSDFASQGDSNSRSNKNGPNSALMALWGPLLLLHLGGPDTITAFSVEDVELWLRHLVGLVVQVALVIYIFLRCWTDQSHPSLILSIPVFVAGVIKYGERTWVLWAANSVFPRPRFPVRYDPNDRTGTLDQIGDDDPNLKLLVTSDFWLQTLTSLQESTKGVSWWLTSSGKMLNEVFKEIGVETKATFRLIEIQLGLMYDLFYTKATSTYCTAGCLLRSISFICMVTVLVAFSIIRKGADYSKVDIDITYLLLVGAVLLEVYGLTLTIYSEWMILWMVGHRKNPQLSCILLRLLAPLTVYNLKRTWSGVVGQFDYRSFLDYTNQKKPSLTMLCYRMLKLLGMGYLKFRIFCCLCYVHDFNDMKIVIIKWVQERDGRSGKIEPVGIERPGELVLKRHGLVHYLECLMQSSFCENIVLFYLFTEVCYLDDHSLEEEGGDKKISPREASICMSRYMFYFLSKYPSVLGSNLTLKGLLEFELMPEGRLKSYEALRVQRDMIMQRLVVDKFDRDEITRKDNKWEILSEFWAEMLCHGAARCPLNHHYKNIRLGGEFLTHVWLLLTLHGLTDLDASVVSLLRGHEREL
ncbi:hypothetical protein RJ639_005476 [Escallonia herrerae]|uniref:DUF4220 domain-containing protein n=1 Tax=Escallonia herrerae TaxID=1293975 RepID=A0AA88VWB9_9ASTE|nr:hypothetical protein RJ639_005476 [Escallonia herrerae]